jgi:hypothetical protein
MPLPQDTGDLPFYAGDPVTIKCDFTMGGVGVDLTTSTWVARLRGDQQFDIDTSDAVIGIIRLLLTDAQSRELPRYARWDLAETGRWNRTVLKGRLMKSGDVE